VQIDEVKRGREQAAWNILHCGTCHETKRAHVHADHEFHPVGSKRSLHIDGLAVDLVLFNGNSPIWKTARYAPLGAFWVGLDPLCAWGGDFGDGGHFSIRHRGMR